jgi:hypothetical protein
MILVKAGVVTAMDIMFETAQGRFNSFQACITRRNHWCSRFDSICSDARHLNFPESCLAFGISARNSASKQRYVNGASDCRATCKGGSKFGAGDSRRFHAPWRADDTSLRRQGIATWFLQVGQRSGVSFSVERSGRHGAGVTRLCTARQQRVCALLLLYSTRDCMRQR